MEKPETRQIYKVLDTNLTMHGSVLITFNDGRNVIYSPDLLRAMIPQAEEGRKAEFFQRLSGEDD